MIKKSKSGYNLVSKSTGKVLGKHSSKKQAVKQEQAIKASQSRSKKK